MRGARLPVPVAVRTALSLARPRPHRSVQWCLAAALVLPWLPLSPGQQAALILFAVLPPAAVNYLLAETYQQEPKKMAAIVLAGNIASLVFVPLGFCVS